MDVVCLGEVIVDMIAMDRDKTLEQTAGFYKFPGGATANVAVGICRLGGTSGFWGALADDAFGRFLKNSLKTEGVDVSAMKQRPRERTVIGFIAVKSDQTKDVIFYRDFESEMFLAPEEINEQTLSQSLIFHFGIICLRTPLKTQTTLKCLELAKKHGSFVSLDVNYRAHAWESREMAYNQLVRALPNVDLLKMADEEFPLLFGIPITEQKAEEILKKGPCALVISHGARGATVFTEKIKLTVPGFKINAVETTGAGDAFTASLLVQISNVLKQGKSIDTLSSKE